MQKAYLIKNNWDIFCKIVDNYGDIGVCWRLARQLRYEHGLKIRLWIDDVETAKKIITQLDISIDNQICNDIIITKWDENADFSVAADVVIEAFGCELPPAYLAAMVQKQSIWINLEYLSAEPWIDDFHAKSSPQVFSNANSSLIRHFYFPGFTLKTGGLIRETYVATQLQNQIKSNLQPVEYTQQPSLINSRPQAGESAQSRGRGATCVDLNAVPPPNLSPASEREALKSEEESLADAALKISFFCYPNAPVYDLFDALQANNHKVHMYVPQSSILSKVAEFFGKKLIQVGDICTQSSLTVEILPFLSQDDYDQLLRDCDLNFVRGEDSWIRAIWAGKPFIWQPYFQEENTHMIKLNAFLNLFYANYEQKQMICEAHRYWSAGQESPDVFNALISTTINALDTLQIYTLLQAKNLAKQPDLASQLVKFSNAIAY